MKKNLRIFFAMLHAIAVKCWLVTILVLYRLNWLSVRKVEFQSVFNGLKKGFFYFGLVCVIVILFGGMGRSAYPIDVQPYLSQKGKKRRQKQLPAVFIIIFLVFIPKICWWYKNAGMLGLIKEIFYLGLACVFVHLLTETVINSYMMLIRKIYGGDLEKTEKMWPKAVIIMHIILLSFLAGGTYWQYILVFR